MYSARTIYLSLMLVILFPVVLFAQLTDAGNPFSLSRSNTQSANIRFQLPHWELENVELDGVIHQRVKVENTPYLFIDEKETLPVFTTMIAIPYSGGYTLNSLNTSSSVEVLNRSDFDRELYNERSSGRIPGTLYPQASVVSSEPQILRDYRVVTINVYPFQYDMDGHNLIVNPVIDIQLNFNSLLSVNELSPPRSISRGFEKIYRGLILNYNEMITRDTVYQNPVLLVIYGNFNDAIYQTKVNEYVAWKKQKGFKVYSASTATTGTTSANIKTYIQNAYDTWPDRPDYVVLIGDTDGSIAVPTFSSYVDYQYTWLAGGDNLGDLVIGRISVTSSSDLVTYLGKVMSVERDIDISNAGWLNKMVLVGDTYHSGISTIYTNHYVSDVASEVNPDYTYTTLYNASPSSTSINTAINQGVAFYNYRGYIGMSGWPSTMNNMFNSSKLFHAVFITCNTGTFGGATTTATTESVIRYGTEATLGGAVTAIGMATSSTHTPMNNCLNVGIFHGLYPMGLRDMGSAMLVGKLYLNSVYGVSNPTQALNFAQFCNIMGDPTATVYVGIPNTFIVDAPATIAAGTTNIMVSVSDGNRQIVEGAAVTITNASSIQIVGYTNEYGYVVLDTPATMSGSYTITVNKDDFKPSQTSLTVNAAGGIVYDSYIADDDTATGNGDGIVNPGESINLYVSLKNTTASTIFLSGVVNCSDPYVSMQSTDRIEFNSIAPNSYGENDNPIIFSVASNCPDDYQFTITLSIEGSLQNWTISVPIVVQTGKLQMLSYSFVGASGNVVNPGNVFPLTFSLKNIGSANLNGISAILRSYDVYFEVQDSLGAFGNIAVNSTVSNNSNSFQIYARGTCIDGMTIPLELYLYNASGYCQSIGLTVTIGQTTVNDPLGQDAYGYFIFDQSDSGYLQCPTYSWVPIATAEGGSGTLLSLTDPGSSSDEGDQVGAVSIQTVNLPFAFNFYGQSYTRASISSNGFIAFGATQDSDWRNWRLPGPGGPNPMIAVFWDDLQLNTGSGVYTYYNSAMHYYVVEWYNVISGYDRVTPETFQAILYDPIFYPTITNDGQIKLQYKVFNNIDLGDGDTFPHGNYSTIGIKDHNGTVGLEYTFNNTYPTAAAPLANNKSLFISTRPILSENPHLTILQTNILDPNANGYLEPGENSNLSILLRNSGLSPATNVSATLTSTSPYVTINIATASYGNIAAEAIGTPLSNHAITVSSACINGQQIAFTLTITGSGNTWIYNFTLTVNTPVLDFGSFSVNDTVGNHNGILDPGETAYINIALHNTGLVASPAGNATISSTTTGITIVSGSTSFTAIQPLGFASLTFSISTSTSISVGTMANLVFNAIAGSFTATKNSSVEVGAPLQVVIGTGDSAQGYPIDRWYNYSAHEAIYLNSEIGMAGSIKSVAFYKSSGTDVGTIESVSIYMKHTSANSISAGDYSLAGYTLVYNGAFTNNAESGWMEVNLNNMFEYDGTQNLSLLCIKGFQQYVTNYSMWTYTTSTATRARENRSDSAAPTSLVSTNALPNLRLKVFPAVGTLYPPQNLVAAPGFASVTLTWETPISGTPTGYKIFKNSASLTTISGLSYTDNAVVNNTNYSYYLKAVYNDGESDPSETVNATPYAPAPNNLTALSGNQIVSLSWQVPDFGTPTGYRVFRNGTLFTTATDLLFNDVDVVNGSTYSYYVTALYGTEEGNASPTIQATPIAGVAVFFNIGNGTSVSGTSVTTPINVMYKSVHSQFVYTAAELNAAGIVGPISITQLGFDVVSVPDYTLPNFLIRMKHTNAANAINWHSSDDMQTVYSATAYMPTAGGWDMLSFNTPFTWNGTDNLLIDTAFGIAEGWTHSGTLRYNSLSNGQRWARNDDENQTNVFSGGSTSQYRPNIRLAVLSDSQGATISLSASQLNFGEVEIGNSAMQPFTIQNTGDQLLAGYVAIPAGYALAESRSSGISLHAKSETRTPTDFRFAISQGASQTFYLTFTPTLEQSYNGNVLITSNATNNGSYSLSVSGTGAFPTLATPAVAISHNGTSAMLQWNTIPNAHSYQVFRSSNPAGPYSLVGTTSLLQWTEVWQDKAFYCIKATTEVPTK